MPSWGKIEFCRVDVPAYPVDPSCRWLLSEYIHQVLDTESFYFRLDMHLKMLSSLAHGVMADGHFFANKIASEI